MRKILLIDADKDFVYLTGKILTSNAFNVVSITDKSNVPAADISQVEQVIQSLQPDYILLEYNFYDDYLADVCRKIRATYRGIIVLMSENIRVLSDYRKFLANGYLAKPFNSKTLIETFDAQ